MMLLMFIWLFALRADVFSSKTQALGLSMQDLAIKFGQAGAALILVLIIFIYCIVWKKHAFMKIIIWIEARLPEKWSNRLQYWVDEFSIGLSVIRDPKALAKIAAYSVLIWATITLTFYPLYWA